MSDMRRNFFVLSITAILLLGSIIIEKYINQISLPVTERTLSIVGLLVINLLWCLNVYLLLTLKRCKDKQELLMYDLLKFKQVVEGVSDQVVITDPEGIIIYANKAATAITGYAVEEIVGNKPSLWGKQMPNEFYERLWKTIKVDKIPFMAEITNRRKNGQFYEAEIQIDPILDRDGTPLFFVSVERDLSRFKNIERVKTEFIALASHQLRTPLSAIKWFAEILMGDIEEDLTKTQRDYLLKIKEANDKEIQLVNALLNISRIESGRLVIIPKMTDLNKLIDEVLCDFKVEATGGKREWNYSFDKNIKPVELDEILIKNVYANLISNAVKYSKPGGRIDIKVSLKDGEIISEISDEGIGIPEEEQSRVFEKFFRGSNALKKETEGNGLGLYLVKVIVESSGGRVWYKSEEDKGTIVGFSLPVKTPP